MTNEIILVPGEETKETPSPQHGKSSRTKERFPALSAEKKLPADKKEIPISHWIMPPEQQGYIQGNDKDCL